MKTGKVKSGNDCLPHAIDGKGMETHAVGVLVTSISAFTMFIIDQES
jgi:hypothetical protein